MNYSKLNLTNFNTEPKKTKNKIEENKYLNCLVMNASNKRRINEKKNAAFISRAAFNNIFACPCGVYLRAAFIRGRRLFE